jgi:hypothetical protein
MSKVRQSNTGSRNTLEEGNEMKRQNADEQSSGELMTGKERMELAKLLRLRAKVAKTSIETRQAELLADVERQLATIYKHDNAMWKDITAAAEAFVSEVDDKIAEICRTKGVPEEFRPSIYVGWHGRGENAAASRRTELRAVARTRIEADVQTAKHTIERITADSLTQLAAGGLTSGEAKRFLESMPGIDELVPLLKVDELKPERKSLSAPNALEDILDSLYEK